MCEKSPFFAILNSFVHSFVHSSIHYLINSFITGNAIKEFYEPLNDYDKNVARSCFLGGFLTSWTSSQVSEDGFGFLGLHAGAAYNLPNDIK